MQNRKLKTTDLIMLLIFFVGVIVFVGVLMYFSKPQDMETYKISSVDDMLIRINADDAGINKDDIDFILDVKTVLDSPKDYMNKVVSWQGKIKDVSGQNYKGAPVKFLKILTDDSSEFVAGFKSGENFKTNDVILVKGIIKGVYPYSDAEGNSKDFPVLKGLEFEIKKSAPAPKPAALKSLEVEKSALKPEEFNMQTPTTRYTLAPAPAEKPKPKPAPSKTPEVKPSVKATPKAAPSYEYKFTKITQLDEKYFTIAESYAGAKNKKKALIYYKKYLQVAPNGSQAEAAKNKIKELEGK